MQTSTSAWWRWRSSHAFGHNPLVRMSDRFEAFLMVMAVAASLIAIPMAGALAVAIHHERGRAYVAQVADREKVEATVTEHSSTLPRTDVTVVEARWQHGGIQHAERFQSNGPVKAGETVDIWVHPDGQRVEPMDPWWRAGVDAALAGVNFWLAVTVTAAVLVALARPCLRQVRYAAWKRELASLADDGGTTNRPT